MKIAIGTRFWGLDPEKDLPRLAAWTEGALSVSSLVFVAVNVDADKTETIKFLREKFPSITVIPVTPWGKFVMPLNALVLAAIGSGADSILFASAEFPPSKQVVDGLAFYLTKSTLVVGARLPEHDFNEALNENANGKQVPWNAYSLWNLKILALTGFLLIGDSPFDPDNAGVEELTTIATLQYLTYNRADAILLAVDGIPGEWDTRGWSAARHVAHEKKMASKVERPAAQMKCLGPNLKAVVHHVG